MNAFRCCFAGHSEINDSNITEKIKNTANVLIHQYGVKEFWTGNYGAFDRSAAAAIRSIKRIHKEIVLNLIIPYVTYDINKYKEYYYEKFDNILIADIPEKTPKNLYIIKSNEYMIDNSDFLICYVKHSWGGAAKTLEYAKRKRIKIYNI